MDLYLSGGNGSVEEPLQLQSTSLLASTWNMTLFSTVNHPATGLDYYLASFPAASTFSLDHVPVTDNTIYYARIVGDGGTSNYARIHVHRPGGSFPIRAVEVKVSLQRGAGLLYACQHDCAARFMRPLAFMMPPGMKP